MAACQTRRTTCRRHAANAVTVAAGRWPHDRQGASWPRGSESRGRGEKREGSAQAHQFHSHQHALASPDTPSTSTHAPPYTPPSFLDRCTLPAALQCCDFTPLSLSPLLSTPLSPRLSSFKSCFQVRRPLKPTLNHLLLFLPAPTALQRPNAQPNAPKSLAESSWKKSQNLSQAPPGMHGKSSRCWRHAAPPGQCGVAQQSCTYAGSLRAAPRPRAVPRRLVAVAKRGLSHRCTALFRGGRRRTHCSISCRWVANLQRHISVTHTRKDSR